jgi:uncharacterized protein (TIGR02594 family)
MNITAYWVAERFEGTKEVPGRAANPQVMAMLNLDSAWPEDDEVPWCSGFVNYVCWILRLPRSKSLRARSWLNVGRPIPLNEAEVGWDVVIFNRADGPHDPNIIDAPGHVAFYAGMLDNDWVYVLGGNQGDTVKVSRYPVSDVLGVRRLREEAA